MADYDPETGEIRPPRMPPEIAQAIIEVKAKVKQLGADERNEHARYNYVSVDKFYAIVGPLMAEAGLALLINEAESEVRVSEGERKTPWLFCRYELTFLHKSGAMSSLPMSRSLATPINGPQSYGAAQSYIEKQFLRQIFKVPTGEKDADETAQDQIAPAGRAGGRAASEARRVPQQAAAERDASAGSARDEATKRWKEIAAAIDDADTVPELERIEAAPAWKACQEHIVLAEGETAAREAMAALSNRIGRRRGLLLMDADERAPLPI